MNKGKTALAALAAAVLAGCGQAPLKPGDSHLREQPSVAGTIPPPVQITPVLPQPKPAARPETYSVVVSNVRVQELLFALARDARLNVDIHPDISGTVTLNAIDQTLPQLLTRIARQVDMRYEIDGQNLVVMRDTPFLRVYRVDYVNMARDSRSIATVSTQVTGGLVAQASSGQNNSTATINSVSANKFWDTLVGNIKEILQETDKVIPAAAPPPAPSTTAPTQAGQIAPASPATPAAPPAAPVATFREAASVIANPETGILNIRATSRQHEKVQEFLDSVMTNARRQVLIEATVAEVQLNNQYQRGIDWQRLRSGATTTGVPAFGQGNSGIEFGQTSVGTPAGINTNAFVMGGAIASLNFNFALKFLESFGDVRVLSSPKISVLNNQTAVLKVVDNLVYFTIQAQSTANQTSTLTTFTTTLNSVPVGFIMSLVPQISDTDTVVLNLRPTISRKIGDVADPNPSLATAGVTSLVPVIQTREMESVLRVQSGQVAVLGGLMQDAVT
ncbi:MAG TPA: type II and III secretion system protein, partial [Burkholderiales bacterium]|nr:type II and III secretion system protein [Burkholderiales bacterium]